MDRLEDSFYPLMERLDDMPGFKSRAVYLHQLVYKPKTEDYVERHIPTTSMSPEDLARYHAGTLELFDDWSLPFKFHQNSVMVNHQIHSQMDFEYEGEI